MHYLVSLIVTAVDKEEAYDKAFDLANSLVDNGTFDWFDEAAETSRWPECWKPFQLSSKRAQTLLAETMRGQRVEFSYAIKTIREMLKRHTDEQIFNEDFSVDADGKRFSRYQFKLASGYEAMSCQIYTEHGVVLHQRALDKLLASGEEMWVVQVDCHQ